MGHADGKKRESVFKKERSITDEEKNSGGLIGPNDGHGTGDPGICSADC